jgi:hypothetical protein
MLSPEKDGDTLLGEGKNRGRLDHLLDEPEVPRAEPIWSVSDAMKLDPTLTLQADDQRAEEKLTRLRRSISATAFKTYLEDPSQYWMKQALGMSESKHGEMELDAAGFGTMTHAALEAFGHDKAACALGDAEKIAKVLEANLDKHFTERFGSNPSSALKLQKGIALDRLRRLAQAQAEVFAEGWRIIETEGKLPEGKDPQKDGLIPHFTLRGRFDRLDCNINPGPDGRKRYRVYDYKTFARTQSPMSKHLYSGGLFANGIGLGDFALPPEKMPKKLKKGEVPELKLYRWKDLQLPAYHWALTTHHDQVKTGTLEVAYFCISSDPDEDPVQVWKDFERYRLKSVECMCLVAEALISEDPESFKPSLKPSPYPILPGLSGRITEDYMNVTQLGVVKKA